MTVIISFEIVAGDDEAIIKAKIEKALNESVKKIMTEIEAAQIHKYTKTSHPALPTGSRYNRTFELRRSSRKKITKPTLPTIKGRWSATADYAADVIGSRAQQTPMFAGRWKSTEDVTEEVQPKAEKIVASELEQIK